MEQTELSKSLNVVYQPHPVVDDRRGMVCLTDGKATVRDVLLASGVDPHQPITIQLDGRMLTVEEWDLICPNEGQLLSVQGTVQGGGGGSNPLQVIAIIAIAVIATTLTMGTGAILGATIAGNLTVGMVAGAIVSVAGSLLIGALFAPKPPTMPNAPPQVSPTYSLSGGQNRARPYEPMPVVMGTHRLFLDYASRPYTEYQGNDQYLIQIFNLGLGNISATDYKIGTTPLSSFTDVGLFNSDSNGRLSNFPGNVDSASGAPLTTQNQSVERTTSTDTYTIGLDFEAVLFAVDNGGTFNEVEMEVAVDYRLSGSSTWVNASAAQTRLVGDNVEFKTDPFGRISIKGNSQKPSRVTFFIEALTPATYDVRVTRLTREAIDNRESYQLNWSIIRSYQLDNSDYKGQNRLGVIIKATEQLNGVVQQLSATVTAQATYWNGSAWVTGATSNPAHWFMHFARGVYNSDGKLMYGIGLSDSQIDLASLTAWASFCATEGLTFNAVLDSTLTAADVLTMLGTAGFGSPSWASGKLGVVYDARNASAVMAFGMSNIIRDSFEVAYISENLADEIVVRFSNPDKDYEQDEVRVLAPDVVTPTRTSAIDLFGCTSATMAGKFANYVAAQQFYRRRRVTWQSDFEGFVCQRGDVVLLSHDMTQWGYSGRLINVNGNTVTLDRSVPRQNQVEYLMLIRPDGTTTTYDVSPSTDSESDTLFILDEVFTLQEGANLIDHRWAFSPLETPGKKLKILSVQPASDSRLQIVATDEFEEFYDAWNGTFVAPVADTILPAVTAAVSNLTASSRVAFVNGYLTNRVALSWNVTSSVLYSRVKIFLDGNLIREIPEAVVPYFEIDIAGAGTYYAEVTPFSITGAGLTANTTLNLTALDLPSPPTTVTLTSGEQDKAATFEWTPVLGALSYVIEIAVSGAVKRTVNVGNTLSYTYTLEEAQADGGAFRAYTFRVYSVNQVGQSTTFVSAEFSNPQIGQLQNVSIEPMPNSLWFKADKPTESDYAAIKVWISKTSGFTPSDATLSYDGAETFVTISADAEGNPLESGVVYYVRAAAYDTFGDDNLTLTAELSATILSPAWGLLQDDIETSMLESGLRDRIDLIDTSGGADFPNGLVAGFQSTNTALATLSDNTDLIGEKLLESALKIQDNTDLLYDAGVTVDSTTGEVYIFAVRETENRLDSAEIRLDAAEANINLRATTAYVDQAIVDAVIDPSQIAELDDLYARVGQAEIDIDANTASINLKADNLVVQAQDVRLTQAEVDIDALEGEIVLKASNTDLEAVEDRVSTAEVTLNALDVPGINLAVQDVRYLDKNQDQIAETQLRDILQGEKNFTELDVSIAQASLDLRAYTDGKLISEATARLELGAQLQTDIGLVQASVVEESIARTTQDGALAAQITALDSSIGDTNARITEVETTKIGYATKGGIPFDNDGEIVDSAGVDAWNAENPEDLAVWNEGIPFASAVKQVSISDGEATLSLEQQFVAQRTTTDEIEGKYSVKIDNNGYVSGFGLISTPNNGTPFAEFSFIADRFSIAPVATDPTAVDGSPFFVLTAPQTINGVTVAPGTYIKQAFIYDAEITTAKIEDLAVTNAKIFDLNAAKITAGFISADRIDAESITADKIDTRNLTIKDSEGNILFGSGTDLDVSNVTGLGAFATEDQITDTNISTYIANAAISNAYIADLSADKIDAGTLSADRIGSQSITADKLSVSQLSAITADLGEMTAGTITAGMIKSDTSGTFNGGTFTLGNSSSINGFLSTVYTSQSFNGRSAIIAEHADSSTTNTQSTAGLFINFARQSPALLVVNAVNPLLYSVQTSTGIGYGRVGITSTYGVNITTNEKSRFSGAIQNVGAYGAAYGSAQNLNQPLTEGFVGFVGSGGLFRYYSGTAVSKQISLALSTYAAFSGAGEGKFYAVDGIGPFTGYHEGLIDNNAQVEIGDIIVDGEPYKIEGISDTTFYMGVTDQDNQKGVIGVCSEVFDEPPHNWLTKIEPPKFDDNSQPIEQEQTQESLVPEGYKVINVNAVGEGQINVCGLNGDIEKGDLIVASAMPGKGMKQTDDIIRSYTVAKARVSVTFDYPEQVKMIPCIYVCG